MISDAQILTIVLAAVPPTLAVMVGISINNAHLSEFKFYMDQRFNDMGNNMNQRFSDMNSVMNQQFGDIDRRFDDTDRRISELREEMNRRFDESKDIWRSELHRVEEILDARLKHLEQR